MRATDILHRDATRREDDLRAAVFLGAGAVLAGGTLWWAWNRSRLHRRHAPGRPGAAPRWNFSSKDGVGTALGPDGRSESRVWFTLRHGAFTEIFYPGADRPAVRDLGLVVTDGCGLFSDERWDAAHEMSWLAEGVPAYELVNTCRRGRYRVEKTILAHPRRDAIAHAEYLRLRRSILDDRVFDTPPQTVQRYLVQKVTSRFVIWRTDHRRRAIPAGKALRIEVKGPAAIHWDVDGQSANGEARTRDTGLGVHVADLSTAGLHSGSEIRLTLSRTEGGWWQKKNGEAIKSDVVRVG